MQTHLLIWDGGCGFCRRAVAWVARRDHRAIFRPMAFADVPSPPMTPELLEACRQAVHVVTADGRVLRAGRASLFILAETGNPRLAALLSRRPFIWLVEWAYRLLARHRRFFSAFLFRP